MPGFDISLGLIYGSIGALSALFTVIAILKIWGKKRPRLRIGAPRLGLTSAALLPFAQFTITFDVKNGWKRAKWLFSHATDIIARITLYDSKTRQKFEELSSAALSTQTLYPGAEVTLRQDFVNNAPSATSFDVSIILECLQTGQGKPRHFKNVLVTLA